MPSLSKTHKCYAGLISQQRCQKLYQETQISTVCDILQSTVLETKPFFLMICDERLSLTAKRKPQSYVNFWLSCPVLQFSTNAVQSSTMLEVQFFLMLRNL
uniref:Uncharacterized protein n=1 Tax=Micrurus paraensis TaxID=1970185 RepID=A0A2D4K904_9SAUR